ncbi:hypothetical protein NEIPOLOT_02628 [Neisseria polysaccharea ATCC 43768]|nr:hypothetical protein NEIPOLOT_02628 [Neisseria polysaccharea ATCC 43768]
MGKIRRYLGRKQPKTCVGVLVVGGKGILQRSHYIKTQPKQKAPAAADAPSLTGSPIF